MVGFAAFAAEERARDVLAQSPIYALRQLRVESDGDSLLLHGHVGSFYLKQLAQEAVRSVAADVPVVNTVDVG